MKLSFLYGLSRGDFYLFLTEKDLDCPVTPGLSDQGRLCIVPVCRAVDTGRRRQPQNLCRHLILSESKTSDSCTHPPHSQADCHAGPEYAWNDCIQS